MLKMILRGCPVENNFGGCCVKDLRPSVLRGILGAATLKLILRASLLRRIPRGCHVRRLLRASVLRKYGPLCWEES